MKAHKTTFTIRFFLIFTLLIGGLSFSAVAFADSLFAPLGLAPEGSLLAAIFHSPQIPSTLTRGDLDVPIVATDNGRYLAGETAVISGSGYTPGQIVTLQIVHSDGTAEAGGGHETTSVQADDSGNFTWNWPVGRDANGLFFHLYVDGVLADKLGRVANIRTDKNDYQPGETAHLALEGFDPGERVTLQVVHLNGQNAGAGHEPFDIFADSHGKATADWYVDPDDSFGEIFGVSAIGASSNIATYTSFTDATVTIVDDGGPDDNPGQKDLSFLEINDAIVNNRQAVRWGWDDLRWTGNNTGDACVLYDSDADGFANFALCVTISQTVTSPPPTFQLYTCGDHRTDRCDQPANPVPNQGSTGTASIIDNIDPFRLNPAHQTNDCNGTDCVNDDSVAAVSVLLTDVGGTTSRLTNVCSYPSGQPNSDPSDCILNPNNGRLTIIKSATPNDGTQFTFTASAPSAQGVSSWSVNGSGTAANQASYAAGNTLDLTEVVPSAFDLTGVSCFIQTSPVTATGTFSDANNRIDNVTIQAGLETICTFTNGPANGTLIVNKTLTNDNGGTKAVTDFSYKVNGGADVPFEADASNSHTVPPGNYNVVENAATGYTATYNNCTNVNVPAGGTATCTITNNDNAPSLTLVKSVTNDNGGTATASQWTTTATGTGGSPTNLTGAGGATSGATFKADTYTLAESGSVPGYTNGTQYSCVKNGNPAVLGNSITLALGDVATCTITNNDDAPSLTLVKSVTNDNGGTATANQWTTTATGTVQNPTNLSGAGGATSGATFKADTYTLAESGSVPGYTNGTQYSCVKNGDPAVLVTSITLANGDVATCTITNDDQAPSLTLNKIVTNDNGGTSVESAWTLTANGGTAGTLSGAGAAGNADVVSPSTFKAGTYALSESGPGGYNASAWSCTGTGTQNNASITLAVGQSAVCSITNDDIAPQLTIIKHVINDNGGTAVAGDFTLDSGGTNDTPDNFAGAESPGVVVTLNQGAYSVGETGPSGYAASYSANCSGTISVGESKTCTVTNDDIAPQLTVIKHVINDNGGTASAANFTMNVTGTNVSDDSFAGAESPGTTVTLDQGAYSVDENNHPGYAKTIEENCSGNIAVGETKTCTITNNDIAPKLTITKIVTTDDGGNAVVADFPLFVNGNSVTSGVQNTLSANVLYTATETNQTGYTPSAWSGDCTAGGTITLQPGDVKACTITNNDVAPTLKLVKNVTNDNGGTKAPDDWTLSATAGAPNNDRNFNNAGGSGSFQTVYSNKGYDLAESGPTGYTASVWSCSGGSLVGSVITLNEGETNVTCSITNNDNAPSLTLVKEVTNDNGGTAIPANWTLTAAGYDSQSPDAGTYQLSESGGPSGYTQTSLTCSNSGSAQVSSVTLGLGESVTCTFVNNDNAPSLTLNKVVTNNSGGTATADQVTLTAAGPTGFSGPGPSVSNGASFDAGTYNLSETSLPGYTASDWACTGGTQNGASITLGLGESASCTITNDDQQAHITVTKVVNNGTTGGTAQPNDFSLTLEGNAVSSGVSVPVNPGTYTAGETLLDGYTFNGFTGDCDSNGDVSVALGESKTCTLTNTAQQAYITVIKSVNNDHGGTAGVNSFGLSLDDNATTSGTAIAVSPGIHTAAEAGLSGYAFEGFSGDCNSQGQITIALGQSKSCTLTNNDIAPQLTVIKHVINDNGGSAVAANFTLDSGGIDDSPDDFAGSESGTLITLDAGAYDVTESGPSGYTASFSADCSGSIAIGEQKTCTVTNDDQPGTLIVNKVLTQDNGGTAAVTSFSYKVNGGGSVSFEGDASNSHTVDAGTYSVVEDAATGYTTTYDNCSNVEVSSGETETCTITNNDIAPKLTVIKHVINDNGGTATAANFTLDSGGANATPDNFAGSETGTLVTLDAGSYSVTESGPGGYTASFSADCAGTLAAGDEKTCTVTNDDQTAHLRLVKYVTNNSGGGASTTDFTLSATGPTPISGAGGAESDVNAGTYTISETNLQGYTAGAWSCADESGAAGIQVVLSLNESVTCSITNDDQPGRLIVRKVLRTPIGTHTFQSFSFSINGGNSINFESDGQNEYTVNAGTYNIVENGFPNPNTYVTSYDNCSNVEVSLGETETCTITNVYKTGFVTNSSLCTFDVDDNPSNGSQFRLLYTPDNSLSLYKLNASNPGQYYYNVLHYNDGSAGSLTMNIPYPFVTHGATPIHVYDDVSTSTGGGQTCLTPIGELANQRDQITLATYNAQAFGSQTAITVTGLPLGFSYVNIHLDYGLKKTTGYAKSTVLGNSCLNDADQTLAGTDVPDCQDYTFSNGGTHVVQSINVFKKNPGVGGLNLTLDEIPVRNAPMELRNTRGQLIAPQQLTDEDGWYFINYKHTGKAQDFILKWVGTPYQKTVTLKANAMAQVDFP